jgi:glycosyltransferase involved in cell wall biosynthesis/putative flippase GtrA
MEKVLVGSCSGSRSETAVIQSTRNAADAIEVSPAEPIVDLVVPVYNEEHVLAQSVDQLRTYLARGFPFTWRITVVDNGSTDGTRAVADGLARVHPEVHAVHLDRKGRGLALRTAWTASPAAVLVYMDVDLSTALDALLPLVAPLVSGHSDLACGSRLATTSVVARGPKREFISRTYNLILRGVFATRFRDAQCGFKAVRADVAQALLPEIVDDAWFFDTELLLLAEHNGLRVHEVPVDWVDDPDTRVHVTQTALDDLRGVARLARSFATGGGKVDLGRARRPALDDDFGRRLVPFAAIGTVSTLVSVLLFLLLRGPIGPVAANAVAVTATFLGNTWANRHWTLGGRVTGRHWRGAVGLYLGSLALTSAALVVVAALGGELPAQLLALAVTWATATVARLLLVRSWARRETGVDTTAAVSLQEAA